MAGVEQPTFLKENKMMVVVLVFFLNTVAANMVSTGAFEVYLNGSFVVLYLRLSC